MPLMTLPLVASVVLTAVPSLTAEPQVKFSSYPATQKYTGRPAAVNLRSHPQARTFRTALSNGAKKGPNFAGSYTVVTWGCGSSCQQVAIVNARTGAVYMPGITAEADVKYQLNSRLLVVNPPENIAQYGSNPPTWLKTKYYLWQNNQLVQVRQPK